MNTPERAERGSQGKMADYLRQAIGAVDDHEDPVLQIGPTDLDRLALMLTRSFGGERPLTYPLMAAQLRGLGRVLRIAGELIDRDLERIRAKPVLEEIPPA